MPTDDGAEARAFVLATTSLQRPPYVPEVQLHLAADMTVLWQRAERELAGASEPPYWAAAWAGGQAVARYLLDHRDAVAGRSLFDLASGSGLCVIAAALAGAAPVVANAVDALSAPASRENARANGVDVAPLLGDQLATEPPDVDLVVAGDICYQREMTDRMLAWLRACHGRGSRVLLGNPGRAFLPRQGLVELARYEIVGDPVLENEGVRHAGVFTFA